MRQDDEQEASTTKRAARGDSSSSSSSSSSGGTDGAAGAADEAAGGPEAHLRTATAPADDCEGPRIVSKESSGGGGSSAETTTGTAAAASSEGTGDDTDGDDSEPGGPPFEMGDHVYQWCSFAGIPAVYQHHGIVMDVWKEEEEEEEGAGESDTKERGVGGGGEWVLKIVDFSILQNETTVAPDGSSGSRKTSGGCVFRSSSARVGSCIRVYESCASSSSPRLWHKVQYSSSHNFIKNHLWSRSGTRTTADSSPPGLVRARLQFLLENPDLLPPYHAAKANCECVAVWCKTGVWATLQATSWLSATAAGQIKSTATIASVAAASTVTVPAAGIWGWFGATTQVSLASTQPWLIPAIAGYGVVTVGAPLVLLHRARQQWKEVTASLNTAFWESATATPDVFVECITEWSSVGDGQLSPGGPPHLRTSSASASTSEETAPTTEEEAASNIIHDGAAAVQSQSS